MPDDTAAIGPATVVIDDWRWRPSLPWSGFDFGRAEVRDWPGNHHLLVPWRPSGPRGAEADPDTVAVYRLRPGRGWRRFVRMDGEWRVSRD